MSQEGAGLWGRGHAVNYSWILQHYYPGTAIEGLHLNFNEAVGWPWGWAAARDFLPGSAATGQEDWFWPWYDSINATDWVLALTPLACGVTVDAFLHFSTRVGTVGTACWSPPAANRFPGSAIANGSFDAFNNSNQRQIASQRVVWSDGSFSELPGIPWSPGSSGNPFVGTTVFFPWCEGRSSAGVRSDDLIVTLLGGSANFTVTSPLGTSTFAGTQYHSRPVSLAGCFGGPVKVTSSVPLIASQRVVRTNGSFSEFMGISTGLADFAVFSPWFDSSSGYQADMLVTNPSATATVTVSAIRPGLPTRNVTVGPQQTAVVPGWSGATGNGPVQLLVTGAAPVIASQRVVDPWGNFSEIPGIPRFLTSNDVRFPWYDSKGAKDGVEDAVVVANPNPTSVSVTVLVDAWSQTRTLAANSSSAFYPTDTLNSGTGAVAIGKAGGQVVVSSTGDPVVASQRVVWLKRP